MATIESLEFFLRLVRQKHDELRRITKTMLEVMAGDDPNKKKTTAESLRGAANDLAAVLSSNDVPSWLQVAITHSAHYVSGHLSAVDYLGSLIDFKRSMETHQWAFDQTDETAFDFDAIYEHFKKESRLPELFDQVVSILEGIHDSGEVDSLTMIRSLGKVIATIKRCKDGSYFSLNGAWEFLLSFLNNYMWGELSKLPVLGTAMDALKKTIEETNNEMAKVHQQISTELSRTVGADVKALENKANFQFVAYNKSGHLLQHGSQPLLTAQTA